MGEASSALLARRIGRRRLRDHSDGDPIPCAYCYGDGESCNPENANPSRKVVDWLPPVLCPRCSGTGKEPNHG